MIIAAVVVTSLSSCAEPPVFIMPELMIPYDFKTEVKTSQKQMDLSDQHIAYIESTMTKDNKKFLENLLYNYYDNYIGLKQCNIKISTVSKFLDFYNNMALGIKNG